jgi:hypothetical protein
MKKHKVAIIPIHGETVIRLAGRAVVLVDAGVNRVDDIRERITEKDIIVCSHHGSEHFPYPYPPVIQQRPRLLEWLCFFIPRGTRQQVYEPACNELLRDRIEALRQRQGWSRRWFTFCFGFRIAFLAAGCWRACVSDFVMGLVPEPVRRFVRHIF